MSEEHLNQDSNEIADTARSTVDTGKSAVNTGKRLNNHLSKNNAANKGSERAVGASKSAKNMSNGASNIGKPGAGATQKTATNAGSKAATNAGAKAAANAGSKAATKAAASAGAKAAAGAAGVASGPVGWALLAASIFGKPLGKALIVIILFIPVFFGAILTMPSIILGINSDNDNADVDIIDPLSDNYINSIINDITGALDKAYEKSLQKVIDEINKNGYDYELTMNTIPSKIDALRNVTIPYIISCYELKKDFNQAHKDDLCKYLNTLADDLFNITWNVCTETMYIPTPVYSYSYIDTEVIDTIKIVKKQPVYTFKTVKAFYQTNSVYYLTEENPTAYTSDYSNTSYQVLINNVVHNIDILEESGISQKFVETKEIEYLNVKIKSLSRNDILDIMKINPKSSYNAYPETDFTESIVSIDENIFTNAEMIKLKEQNMIDIMSGLVNYKVISASTLKDDINKHLSKLKTSSLSKNRQQVVKTALSLVNAITFHLDGKASGPDWDPLWWNSDIVDIMGRPYGLDSSGFIEWVYWTAGMREQTKTFVGSYNIYMNTDGITYKDLLPGDIGMLYNAVDTTFEMNIVAIYLGLDENGNNLWISCNPNSNTVSISDLPIKNYRRLKNIDILSGDDLYHSVDNIYLYKNPMCN